jgi:hypothetical protein
MLGSILFSVRLNSDKSETFPEKNHNFLNKIAIDFHLLFQRLPQNKT